MLRSFMDNAFNPAGRLPEPEAVRAAFSAGLRFLSTAALAWALSRASVVALAPMAQLAPFAIALFAAGLLAGLNPAALLAGCLAGALNGGLDTFNLSLPIGCAVILGASLLREALLPRLSRLRPPEEQPRSPNENAVAAALAGLGVLVPGLIYAGFEPWPSALALAAALTALTAAPFLLAGLRLRPTSRFLLPEERTGLFLMACGAAAGLYGVCPAAALGLSMLLAALACPAGALLGLSAGTALLIASGDPRCPAILGLCGAAAQLCRGLPRPARVLSTSAACLAAALFLELPADQTAALCAAPPLAALFPEEVRARARRWTEHPAAACDPDRLAAILRGQSARRLKAMSAAFDDLAEGYLAPASLPDEQALMSRLRERLCASCPGYEDCWNGGENRAAHLLCALITRAVDWSESDTETGLFEEGVEIELSRRCRRSRQLRERVGDLLESFARQRRSELKRGGENRLISAQFLQAAQLIDTLAENQSQPIHLRDRRARQAVGVLERGGIPISDAMLLRGDRTELILTLREGRWNQKLADEAAVLLNSAFGRIYAPQDAWGRTLRLVQQPRLTAQVGIASVSRDPDRPNGDSCASAMLDDERLMALICDGMGSGEAAAHESGAAARLLGRFLAAGAEMSLAVETANTLMLNRTAEDMFSTVDLILLDLSTGMADFLKLAACPALIAREGEIRRVEGGRLPLGILERVEPAVTRVQLLPGDRILLASDGVMDAADPAELEALLLSPIDDLNALAESVIDRAASSAGAHPDDMTAICIHLTERQGASAGHCCRP